MNQTQENSPEFVQQAIDARIRALKLEESAESIRVSKREQNASALAPVSSLPPEIFATIFSFSCSSGKPGDNLARIRLSHICHQWREIAFNLSLLWNHVDSPPSLRQVQLRHSLAPSQHPYIWRQGFLANAGTMFDLIHPEKNSRRVVLAYATLALAQNVPIFAVHFKLWDHLLPLSNMSHYLRPQNPIWRLYLSLILFSMALPLGSLA